VEWAPELDREWVEWAPELDREWAEWARAQVQAQAEQEWERAPAVEAGE
jgi:hypothetical protein